MENWPRIHTFLPNWHPLNAGLLFSSCLPHQPPAQAGRAAVPGVGASICAAGALCTEQDLVPGVSALLALVPASALAGPSVAAHQTDGERALLHLPGLFGHSRELPWPSPVWLAGARAPNGNVLAGWEERGCVDETAVPIQAREEGFPHTAPGPSSPGHINPSAQQLFPRWLPSLLRFRHRWPHAGHQRWPCSLGSIPKAAATALRAFPTIPPVKPSCLIHACSTSPC